MVGAAGDRGAVKLAVGHIVVVDKACLLQHGAAGNILVGVDGGQPVGAHRVKPVVPHGTECLSCIAFIPPFAAESMVNEQRLHSMIKIAKFDANDGKRCKPMIQYARKDYVALQLLKSFVVGTIAFFMMLGLWVLYSMDALMEQINKMDFVKAATTLGLLYGIFMVIYLLATYIIFNMKYTYGRKKVKKYYAGLKKISAMYLREERLKGNGNKDWD